MLKYLITSLTRIAKNWKLLTIADIIGCSMWSFIMTRMKSSLEGIGKNFAPQGICTSGRH